MSDEWDRARNSISMNAIINNRDNDETIRQQQKLREATKIKEKRNQERVECIRKSNSQLRLKFIETNDFIRACSEKEEISMRKIEEEIELKKWLHQEIVELEKKTENLEKFHAKFTNSIHGLKSFEEVLDEVVEKMKLFKSKEDFIDRCDALCMSFHTVAFGIFFNAFVLLFNYSARSDDCK